MEDDEIRTLVTRLSRPHRSGGRVIERVAILAEGGDCDAILRWIAAHGGRPEELAPVVASHGLHGSKFHDTDTDSRMPARFVLPPEDQS